MEYYRYQSFEFYSPVDLNSVRKSKPQSVLTLIDDIYEVYYRLSQPGQVFDIQELQNRTFLAGGSGERDLKDTRRLYKDALSLAVASLLRVLVWREKEIDCAANLCRTAGCEHAVLAAKHPVDTGARLLLGSTSSVFDAIGATYPIYISHPISRPRRDRQKGRIWPPFVKDLDEVVRRIAQKPVGNRHVTPMMPTAIDEFRIFDDGVYLHPYLTPRWPIPEDDLLYTRPSAPEKVRPYADYDDYERRELLSIFDPPIDSTGRRAGLPLSDPEVSGVLRTLKEAVRLQMAGRDHLLVRQCPGFFLYRPLHGEFEFSSGVDSELNTFDWIRDYQPVAKGDRRRRIAFVHDNQDAVGLFKPTRSGETGRKQYRYAVRQISSAIYTYARELASRTNTRPPREPDKAIVAAALQTSWDVDEVVKELHDCMFPVAKEGPIGGEQPLSWDQTREGLKEIIQKEKIKALSGGAEEAVRYSFSGDKPQYEFTTPGKPPDTYIDVVTGLDTTQKRRLNAADRARAFFGKEP